MDFWSLMIKKDDVIIALAEKIRKMKSLIFCGNRNVKKKMYLKPLEGKGEDLYILLNAPSLATQDISVLKDKNTMFVNRGFKHPLYGLLQPKYHVFCDPKMIKGVWPVSWLDEIWSISPDTKIILPLSWYSNQIFDSYRNNPLIYWSDAELPFYNLGVSGSCFAFAIQQEYKNIYFSGFDATGIGHEMVKTADSHF